MTTPYFADVLNLDSPEAFEGEWDFRQVYPIGSIVSYNGHLYVAQTLVDQSQDAVQLRHDDFHRADIADGWGTDGDGNVWDTSINGFESSSGVFSIQSNKGIIDLPSNGYGGALFGNALETRNIEVLLRFSNLALNGLLFEIDFRFEPSFITDAACLLTIFPAFSNNSLKFLDYDDTQTNGLTLYGNFNVAPFPLDSADYFLRITASGDFYSSKLWLVSDPEPSSSTLSTKSGVTVISSYFQISAGNGSTESIISCKDLTILSLPDAPDINTTDWLLIG